ncbi:MAG: 2TM domain-containing protein [Promethearchaeota archaeon]
MSSIIRRLVKEVNKKEDDSSVEEDIPIEHLELAEIARKRVLIKSTLKSHIIIYLLTNTLLILINLNVFEDPIPINEITDFWAAWPILIWAVALIAHAMIVITININDYDKRVFVITTAMNIAIGGLLVYINYVSNYLININTNWWVYVFTFLGFFIIVHAWVVFRDSDKTKLEKKIRREFEKLKELEEKKTLEEEKTRKEILESNYSINNKDQE